MQQLKDLIQELWNGTITPQQLAQLQQLLDKEDRVLKKLLEDEFTRLVNEKREAEDMKAGETLKVLHQKIDMPRQQPAPVRNMNRRWWIAVACVILVATGFLLLTKDSGKKEQLTTIAAAKQQPVLKTVINTADTIQTVALSDSSLVTLYPNSSIIYEEAFAAVNRNITLTGKGYFKVAKDKKRPFTVFAGGFATTALGTEFTVNTHGFSVKLFEGKIVVRSTETADTARYLLPGQEFAYNQLSRQYEVTRFNDQNALAKTNKRSTSRYSDKNVLLDFNNEPLKKVIARLQTAYDIKIVCSEKDSKGIFFTGKFSISDKVEDVLSIICSINGLEYVITGRQAEIKRTKASL